MPIHPDSVGLVGESLHGLCSYGFTGRAFLHSPCDGDPARFKGMDARFSKPAIDQGVVTLA